MIFTTIITTDEGSFLLVERKEAEGLPAINLRIPLTEARLHILLADIASALHSFYFRRTRHENPL